MAKKRFGDILVDGGLITDAQLAQALKFGQENDIKLGQALIDLGFVTEEAVAHTLSRQLQIPFVDLNKIVLDPEIVTIIPESVARKNKLLAIGKRPGEILVALADPLNIFAIDAASRHIKGVLVPCVAVESLLNTAIDQQYGGMAAMPGSSLTEEGEESEAVAAINDILLHAVRADASDIHIEPDVQEVRVRCRVDGILRNIRTYSLEMHPNLISRIKIMSQLDIGERRKPQDGRIEIPIAGKEFDIRVSILPLRNGEKVVMRLLDKSKVKIKLADLGFEPEQEKIFRHHLAMPHEIILVTGPTGSGKTTTLYGALNKINSPEKNIITVEDPVEYDLAGVNQVQVNIKANLTFVSALRSILRQDPDIIMIGEIRDVDTAEIAIQAALTGHMVLSTLHTNDSCGAVARLLDMQIPPFLIASSVGLVLAQRLPRRLCPHCKEAVEITPALIDLFHWVPEEELLIYGPKGCPQCEETGYRGRVAIYELLELSKAIEKMIMEQASSHEIARQAALEGFRNLRQAGLVKVVAGTTSLDEVLRLSLEQKE
ncbi:MAG: ATPase, T2SS/T4P/T4SS family [Desulfurivibrionaceae bacterium]|nr:ATPase, T2SS/T4P/T4SS family [Desulfurivibrionaceae bacterium]